MDFKEISVTDFDGLRIGQAEDIDGGTGCTVLICENGMPAGLDVRGGGPASRESELLKPMAAAQVIHAVLLSGGSAFGLGAANGVMRYLEERGIGVAVGNIRVPLVCQSDIFDLTCGSKDARPDADMAYRACKASEEGNYRDGSFGAGCGATVGKLAGMQRCMKSGIGSYGIQIGALKIAAIVSVNALGDIFDPTTGRKIAGVLTEDGKGLADTLPLMAARIPSPAVTNTTIGAIITNAAFDKTRLCKIAGMAHNGYARAIDPVHTSADGDSIYALSVGTVQSDPDTVGTLAAHVMAQAIVNAVRNTEGGYGFTAVKDLAEAEK